MAAKVEETVKKKAKAVVKAVIQIVMTMLKESLISKIIKDFPAKLFLKYQLNIYHKNFSTQKYTGSKTFTLK